MSEQPGTLVRRAVPRWVWLTIVWLSCIVLFSCGLGLYTLFAWGPGAFGGESSGEMGGASSGGPEGTFAITTPFWQKGNRLAIVGQTQYPNKPKGPSYVVVARLPSSMSWGMGGGSSAGGEQQLYTHTELRDRNGRPFDIGFVLKNDGKTEQVWIGGKPYRPKEGRVFLVDLRIAPAAFKQLKTDFGGVLNAAEPGEVGVKALMERLQARDEEVREFWR